MTKSRYNLRVLKDGLSIPDPSVGQQYFPKDLDELDETLYVNNPALTTRSCVACQRKMAKWILPALTE